MRNIPHRHSKIKALAQLIALQKTSELPVDAWILYLWSVFIILNCFLACAPWFKRNKSMNLLKIVIYVDAVSAIM